MSLRREAASDEEASEEERFQSGAEDASDGEFSDSEADEEPAPAAAPQQDESEEQGIPGKGAPPLPHTGRPAVWAHCAVARLSAATQGLREEQVGRRPSTADP